MKGDVNEPTTEAGRRLLSDENWRDYLCRLPIPLHGFDSITEAVLEIERQARATAPAGLREAAQRLYDRLSRAAGGPMQDDIEALGAALAADSEPDPSDRRRPSS